MNLVLDHLTVRHPGSTTGAAALTDLSLDIRQGEQIALIGPSGAGKTTLLHTLALAQQPASGQLQAFDCAPWALSSTARHALRARLFLAPQTPPLPARQRVVSAVLAGRLPQWSVWQAVRSLVRPADPQAAFDALSRFNLQHKLYARVDRLSGGERQRCGLARLLISRASLFLVDEPLSALDPTLARQTLAVLQEEAQHRNATLICSLHQVELARALFPRIIGLRDGRIVFDLARDQVTEALIAALYRNDHRSDHRNDDGNDDGNDGLSDRQPGTRSPSVSDGVCASVPAEFADAAVGAASPMPDAFEPAERATVGRTLPIPRC